MPSAIVVITSAAFPTSRLPSPTSFAPPRRPRAIEEALDLITAGLGGDCKLIRPALIRYYLNRVAEDPDVAHEVKQRSALRLATSKAEARISIKVPTGPPSPEKRFYARWPKPCTIWSSVDRLA